MNLAYKFRIYPDKEQEELINKTFGCCRFVYNKYLEKRKEAYESEGKSLSFYDCNKDLTQLKKEKEWLQEVDSMALQYALRQLDASFKNFFRGNARYPRFKSKYDHRSSYKTVGRGVRWYPEGYLKLPKLGKVVCRGGREPKGRIMNATVIKSPSAKFYVSLTCADVGVEQYGKAEGTAIVGFSIDGAYITVNGEAMGGNTYYRDSLKRITLLQQRLSRKMKDSANYEKARIKLARKHEHVAEQRKDFQQKLSTKIVRENNTIVVHDIRLQERLKACPKEEALAILDVGWYEFVRQLEYKCGWYGREFVRYDPDSPGAPVEKEEVAE